MSNRKFRRPTAETVFICPFCGADMSTGKTEAEALHYHLKRKYDKDGYQLNVCLDYCSTRLIALYNLTTEPNNDRPI